MNVLLVTPRTYPVPAVKGGAVEKLIEELLLGNKIEDDIFYTVYTPYCDLISKEDLERYKNVEFRFVHQNNLKYTIKKIYYGLKNRLKLYFNKSNVFIETVISDIYSKKEQDKYDKIIIENDFTSILECRKKISGKLIFHIHNEYLKKNTRNVEKIIEACDEIWCISRYIENTIKAIDSKAKTYIIENCINSETFLSKKDEEVMSELRKKLSINDDFVVIYTRKID